MNASYPIRPIAMSELPQFMAVGEHAFNSNWPADQLMAWEKLLFEKDRSLAAFDGNDIIGSTTIISFDLTVPGGGQVGTAGVTSVAVMPSHRRQGVLSSLMNRQLADVAVGSEPVAALFSSESAIYGRYGYGVATRHQRYTIKRGETQLPAPQKRLRLRICDPKAAADSMKQVYDAVQVTRPGMLTRHKGYWDVILEDPEFMRDGYGPLRCVLAEDEAGPRGYALYAAKPKWDGSLPDGELFVHDLFALDRDASLTLWADLFSRDLIGEVSTSSRPLDDSLLYELADPRRTRATIQDGLYIRLVDLPTALTSRLYSSAVDVVIEVTDDRLPANAGRWRLAAGGPADGVKPTCERTTADPDLLMPVVALGAAYLGGTRLSALAEAAVITEIRPGALAALSTAMWWDPAPWAPTSF